MRALSGSRRAKKSLTTAVTATRSSLRFPLLRFSIFLPLEPLSFPRRLSTSSAANSSSSLGLGRRGSGRSGDAPVSWKASLDSAHAVGYAIAVTMSAVSRSCSKLNLFFLLFRAFSDKSEPALVLVLAFLGRGARAMMFVDPVGHKSNC